MHLRHTGKILKMVLLQPHNEHHEKPTATSIMLPPGAVRQMLQHLLILMAPPFVPAHLSASRQKMILRHLLVGNIKSVKK